MKTALWVSLSVCMLALAGCTEEPAPPLTDDDCKAMGGQRLDPAVEQVDNETGETFVGPACVPDVPSATVHLEGVSEGDQLTSYVPVELTWVLHTTLETDHSHNNGIRVSKTSDPSYQGIIDGYGFGLLDGKEEHRDFVEGDSSVTTWTPEDPGTYYVRAYAVSSWGTFWAPEHEVSVSYINASSTTHDLTVSNLGVPPGPAVSNAALDAVLGDTVTWTNGDPAGSWTIQSITRPDGSSKFTLSTADGASLLLVVPGTYTYEAVHNELGEQASASGTITVTLPA